MNSSSGLLLSTLALATACQTATKAEEFEVTDKSIQPGDSMTWVGNATSLEGSGKIKLGEKLPTFIVTDMKMQATEFPLPGHVQVVDTLPSLDTPVCDHQTHVLGETKALDPSVKRLTISLDLPYAQRRFAEESKLAEVSFYSDYRDQSFAKGTGLQIKRNGLLARAVIVVDRNGVVRHLQIVPEITQMPNMEKAFAVANQLAKG